MNDKLNISIWLLRNRSCKWQNTFPRGLRCLLLIFMDFFQWRNLFHLFISIVYLFSCFSSHFQFITYKNHFINYSTYVVTWLSLTAWKVSIFRVMTIFSHSDWTRRDTPYLSVFSPNAGKYGPEQLRIQALFTQCLANFFQENDEITKYRKEKMANNFPMISNKKLKTTYLCNLLLERRKLRLWHTKKCTA